MWVKLTVTKTIEVSGTTTTYHPGDWVDVGKQSALMMVSAGEAIIVNQEKLAELMPSGAHVLLIRETHDDGALRSKLADIKVSVSTHESGAFTLINEHTLILDPVADVKLDLIPIGFRLLDKWQMAVPIGDYHEMAIQIGTKEDKALTRSVIRDLRVPWYDTRMMFVRRCADTRAVLEVWYEEMQALDGKTDIRLAFLRAMYRVKPILCALPTLWSRRE